MSSKISANLKPTHINTSDESQRIASHNEDIWFCTECTNISPIIINKCHECGSERIITAILNKKLRKKSTSKPSTTKGLLFRYESKPGKDESNVSTEKEESNFMDNSFPTSWESLYYEEPKENEPFTQWLRPNQFKVEDESLNEWKVFRNPMPSDISQGALGNCWFLSALAVLAQRPALLKKLFITRKFNPEGCYEIRLYKNGQPVTITIDDYFPCDEDEKLLYSKTKERQLWVPLIEKAAAKMYGSYESLHGGFGYEGLSMLTAYPCEKIKLSYRWEQKEVDNIWKKLVRYQKYGFFMSTSTTNKNGNCRNVGLNYPHAYSVLNIKFEEGNRLILLRDPHGSGICWNGHWSDHCSLWTEKMRASLLPEGTPDDRFWISFEDLLIYFRSFYICKFRARWYKYEQIGFFPSNVFDTDKMTAVVLKPVKGTHVELVLYQKGVKGLQSDETVVHVLDLCLAIFSWDGNKLGKLHKRSVRKLDDFVTCDFYFKPGTYIVLNLAFNHFHDNLPKQEYFLTIHSVTPLDVTKITTPPFILADALIAITISSGLRHEISDETGNFGTLYYLEERDSWSGYSGVIENKDINLGLKVICKCSNAERMVSTRGVLRTTDTVPPLQRQLVILLTEWYPSSNYHFDLDIKFEQVENSVPRKTESARKPKHKQSLEKIDFLHSPRPL